jgi:molecular chaperone DnaJ
VGQVIKRPCKTCGGRGALRRERTLSINIPAGIEDGQRIRLAGEGEPGARNGPKGDLYIFVSVKEHDIFERDGQTLYARAPVPMATAALGGEIELPTIDGGRTRITIPEGAQTGKRMRLKGKGMPSIRGGPQGDLFVELFVETPRDLTAKQKELLRQFSAECCDTCHPESNGFFNRVKKFFDQEDSRA